MTSSSRRGEAISTPVVAVTVTYGDRASLCTQTIAATKNQGCVATIVVSNAADQSAVDLLKAEWRSDVTTRFVDLAENLGSAGGFAAGISVAIRELDASLIWLLDDDNLPQQHALATLLISRKNAITGLSVRDVAVSSFRPDNKMQFERAAGQSAEQAYPQPGSFLYFDIRKKLRMIRSRAVTPRPDDILTIPYGPYGGLLVSSAAVDAGGCPKPELVLYEDDTEFTSRLVACGFPLVLVPESKVVDLDQKWTQFASGTGPQRLLNSQDGRRLFYFVRNRSAYDWIQAVNHQARWWCWLNMAAYFTYAAVQSGRLKKWGVMRYMLNAAMRGKRQDFSNGPRLA